MRRWVASFGIIVIIGCAAWYSATSRNSPSACSVTALDVGQGDSILIQTPDHQDVLIDGGPDDQVLGQLAQALPSGDHDIELMVLTHPHADHVNGLVPVTERYVVKEALLTDVQVQQYAYLAWKDLLRQHHVPTIQAVAGQRLNIGATTHLDVLWPAKSLVNEKISLDNAAAGGGVNDTSIVLRLTCNGSVAMLMGDASSEIEERLLERGENVRAGLLKVGHHGSRFSSSPQFLSAVHPAWAVVSVGAGNHYHHPHPSTLQHYLLQNIPILRTDLEGAIRMVSDGHGVWRRGS